MLLQVSDWAIFFGRFHPVLVHLPIGFLLLAALLEIGNRLGKISVSQSTLTFILFWSAIGATFACVAGYLLSLGGGYDEELLDEHMWQGIGVAGLAWVAWAVKSDWLGDRIPFGPAFYLPALGISTLLTFAAGHHGGGLTHGDGYLTQYTPEPIRSLAGLPPRATETNEIKPIANVPEALVYEDIVKPMLGVHCTQCHNSSKQKGQLRMDTFEYLSKGGENGAVFVAGKSSDSEMLRRCLLPLEDDDHMPPKGKPQLSESQIALISWWIDQGAPADKKVAELQVDEKIKPALASLGKPGSTAPAEAGPKESVLMSIKVDAADGKDLESLKKVNVLVMPVAQGQNIIEISAVNAPAFDDSQIGLLVPLSKQIVWLKLGDTKVTDAAVTQIAKLKNLNKLHLEYTSVSDAGIAQLQDLPHLEYLNLIGTKLTDKGLQNLARLKSLKSVYVWKSAVTKEGVAMLRKARPDLTVVMGLDEVAVAEFLKAGQKTTTETVPPSEK